MKPQYKYPSTQAAADLFRKYRDRPKLLTTLPHLVEDLKVMIDHEGVKAEFITVEEWVSSKPKTWLSDTLNSGVAVFIICKDEAQQENVRVGLGMKSEPTEVVKQ